MDFPRALIVASHAHKIRAPGSTTRIKLVSPLSLVTYRAASAGE